MSIPLIHNEIASMISIPLLGGVIGYVINWTGVWMLYRPLAFVGVRVPGLARLTALLPPVFRDIPGLKHGGVGWQGILPSRAGKLGSIAVDTQIAKIGSPSDFYGQLDMEEMAQYVARELAPEVRTLVDDILSRQYPELWTSLPEGARERAHAGIREQLPDVARRVSAEIGKHIDELVNVKIMVIRLLEEQPELTNRLFHEVGRKEFRFIMRFGFVFGFLAGLPTILLVLALPYWWVLPLAEAVIGAVTNAIGLWLIFEPVRPQRVLRWQWQGLFLRRQHEASAVYAQVIAHEVVTVGSIGRELLEGPCSDRTRELLRRVLMPVIDEQAGMARRALELTHGRERFEATSRALAGRAGDLMLEPLADPVTGERQNDAIEELFRERMRALPPEDFVETMRSATREDEWLLIAHGALFGIVGGLIHWVIFGT